MNRRTLFVDDGDIAQKRDVRRLVHPGRKCAENPILVSEAPWEGSICGGTVRREAEGYRMWYQSYGHGTYINLYATSTDGIEWERPTLGQYEDFDGSLENNIFFNRLALRSDCRRPPQVKQDVCMNVLYTPQLGPDRAYTLLSYDYGRSGYSEYDGHFLAYSPDGVVWTDGPKDPVIPGHADVGWFTYDDAHGTFLGIVKNFLNIRGHHRRSVLATESLEGLDWTLPRPAIIPDLEDDAWADRVPAVGGAGPHTQFYGMPISRYESVLLGFLQVFRVTDTVNVSNDGEIDVQLASSRDGHTWERAGDRRPVLELGEPGSWDGGMVLGGNSLVCDKDEVRLYYMGATATHGVEGKFAIGMATWPRDRLVGLTADAEGGTIQLAPQTATGSLHLNADASKGKIVLWILDTDVHVALTKDSLDHAIAVPPGLTGQQVGVVLELRSAEVFSLWWD